MFASLKQLFVGSIGSGKLELTCSCTAHPSETAGELLPVSWRSCFQCFSKLAESHGWDLSLAGWFSPKWLYTSLCCCLSLMDSGGTIPASAASPLPAIFPGKFVCSFCLLFARCVSPFRSVSGSWEKVQSCGRANPRLTGTTAPGRSFTRDWGELLGLFSRRE